MPLDSDMLVQQQILLGGQVSNKYKIFMDIARMSPDWAEIYHILKTMPQWETEPDENKVVLDIVELFGIIDFVRNCTEITVLSMIMGDTRGKFNVKGAMDDLRKSGSNP